MSSIPNVYVYLKIYVLKCNKYICMYICIHVHIRLSWLAYTFTCVHAIIDSTTHTYKPTFHDKYISHKLMILEHIKWCKKMHKILAKTTMRWHFFKKMWQFMTLAALPGSSIRFGGGWPSSSVVKPLQRSSLHFDLVGLPRPTTIALGIVAP